jgi:hypothetical protein
MLFELRDAHGVFVDNQNFKAIELQSSDSQFICHTQLLCYPVHCFLNFLGFFKISNSINLVNYIRIDIYKKLYSGMSYQ